MCCGAKGLISLNKEAEHKAQCALKKANQCALKKANQSTQTDFAQQVIFPREFRGIIINILKEYELDKLGDWRKVIITKDSQIASCIRCSKYFYLNK